MIRLWGFCRKGLHIDSSHNVGQYDESSEFDGLRVSIDYLNNYELRRGRLQTAAYDPCDIFLKLSKPKKKKMLFWNRWTAFQICCGLWHSK